MHGQKNIKLSIATNNSTKQSLLKKLTAPQLVTKFSTFCGIQSFITVVLAARRLYHEPD